MERAREWWRRGRAHQYLAELEPIDRATALIVLALLTAFVASYAAIAAQLLLPVPA
jgi:hypothetical protein